MRDRFLRVFGVALLVLGVSTSAARAQSHVVATDLATFGGSYSAARGVSKSGHVVGQAQLAGNQVVHAFYGASQAPCRTSVRLVTTATGRA